jgi:hypothetical protein
MRQLKIDRIIYSILEVEVLNCLGHLNRTLRGMRAEALALFAAPQPTTTQTQSNNQLYSANAHPLSCPITLLLLNRDANTRVRSLQGPKTQSAAYL